jgi:flagellar hook assembly protein FlgD
MNVPKSYVFFQNHPNPFNPQTEICFALPEANHVLVKIFNTLGEEILTLVDGKYEAGLHGVLWDSKDKNGMSVPSGVYLCKLQAGVFSQVKKMSLVR